MDTYGRGSCLSVDGFAELARERMDSEGFDVIFGAAPSAPGFHTVANNVGGFQEFPLLPRVLSTLEHRSTTVEVLSAELRKPWLFAPMGQLRRFHPDGELAVAEAARLSETTLILSMATSTPIEEVVEASGGHTWFQVYFMRERSVTEAVVRRAEEAGCGALVVTVDGPGGVGSREREQILTRDQVRTSSVPDPPRLAAFEHVPPTLASSIDPNHFAASMHPQPSWADIDWLRSVTSLPIVLKGIQTGADAHLAVARGVEGVGVSNHGGHTLDFARSTIETLPEVVSAVAGAVPILIDGGFRRGDDVLKALCLGARAILLGRAVAWPLIVGGAPAILDMLEGLASELDRAMALCGINNLADLQPGIFTSHRQSLLVSSNGEAPYRPRTNTT
jgi:isopentenyl diphosphate isomerase/L-lactate dehydrogenase-like FMN-dependent dehydrogenase